jgi:hypothetical protein
MDDSYQIRPNLTLESNLQEFNPKSELYIQTSGDLDNKLDQRISIENIEQEDSLGNMSNMFGNFKDELQMGSNNKAHMVSKLE